MLFASNNKKSLIDYEMVETVLQSIAILYQTFVDENSIKTI